MSGSSGTTLISPTATTTPLLPTQETVPSMSDSSGGPAPAPGPAAPGAGVIRRTSSNHGAGHGHAHAHHGVHKRRQGSHSHAAHTHSHGHGAGGSTGNRRQSEGEHGRRAMAAGLAMQTLEKPRRKGSHDKPPKTSSRSDTNLPGLSRVNSDVSNKSSGGSRPTSRQGSRHSSRNSSPSRPQPPGRKRSVVLDAAGNEGKEVDSDEEDWEEEDEGSGKKRSSRPESPSKKAAAAGAAVKSGDMRRTMSDSHAPPVSAYTDTDAEGSGAEGDRPPATRKTTGFAGTLQTPDPSATTPSHALNDPTHVMPAHQIKHQQSARSLHALTGERTRKTSDPGRAPMPSLSRTSSGRGSVREKITRTMSNLSITRTRDDVVASPRPDSETGTDAETPDGQKDGASARDSAPSVRYDESDRITNEKDEAENPDKSPSYPFPRLPTADGAADEVAETTESPEALQSGFQEMAPPAAPKPHRSRERDERRSRERGSRDRSPRRSAKAFPPGPSRLSTAAAATDSTSSSSEPRSRQTSGRTLRHRYSNSSIRSIQSLRAPPHPLNSPTGYRSHMSAAALASPVKAKAPSMHYPPAAPPVINSEQAEGHAYDLPDDELPPPAAARERLPRSSSFASARSFSAILGNAAPPSIDTSVAEGSRRRTALEATSRAAKYRTTTNAAEYHSSLGYPSTSAETAHLISRFLPPKKIRRPTWDLRPEDVAEGREMPEVSLTNGDYRGAHEALVRTMRTMGVSSGIGGIGSGAGARRGMSMVGRTPSMGGSGILGFGALPHSPLNPIGGSAAGGAGDGGGATGIAQALAAPGVLAGAVGAVGGVVRGAANASAHVLAGDDVVGVVRGRNGSLIVGKGGWNGRTPVEMSVDRCLAQRPAGIRGMSGL